jgi:hypothetical protein
MRRSTILRTAGYILVGIGIATAAGALVVRDQMSRHQRNLFSRQALKRFAALAYLSGVPASVEMIRLLRDFAAWERNSVIRRRALLLLARMERQLEEQPPGGAGTGAGAGAGIPAGLAG